MYIVLGYLKDEAEKEHIVRVKENGSTPIFSSIEDARAELHRKVKIKENFGKEYVIFHAVSFFKPKEEPYDEFEVQ